MYIFADHLCSFQRDLAAEALRLNENDTQRALDLLTDPERNFLLQVLGFLSFDFSASLVSIHFD